jgi:tripartite-type tricarboxylate transporter receptor subunit TctC
MLQGAEPHSPSPLLATSAQAPGMARAAGAGDRSLSAGGGADTVSRIFFTKLSETMGQQFVIDNRGGRGTIAAAVAAKADPTATPF